MLPLSPMPLLFLLLMLSAPAATALAQTSEPEATPVRVLSFNIRYNNPGDSIHAWPNRKDYVANLIRFHDADLVGVQEALKEQVDTLAARLPGYGWFGVGRDDGREAGEFSAIFYRESRFEVLEEGTFWLSETPDSAGSTGWDAALPRVVTWGRLQDRTSGETFFFFNTHFDHRGQEARLESARLIRNRLGEMAGDLPFVLTGDFNTTEDALPYAALTDDEDETAALFDAYYATQSPPYGPEATFHGFVVTETPGARIDYIFVSEDVRVLRYGALSDQWLGRYPSDHLPVLADVVIGAD